MSEKRIGNTKDVDKLQSQKMIPTVVIALGGSGKKSAVNLRKLFYEKYGERTLPIVEFLYLDTDVSELTIANEELYQLDPVDTIDASIEANEFDDLMRDLKDLSPHIHKWFDAQKIASATSGGVADGAKKIRALGKLAFFLKYDEFTQKLEQKLRLITSEPKKLETKELLNERDNVSVEFGDDFEIVVIGSLAGGTGSGSFLDVAFAAKNIAKRQFHKIPQMTAMLCLPSSFDGLVSDEREKAYANGYAALKELDYYLSYYDQHREESENDFLIDFEWKRGTKETVSAPPFNTVYLLEDENMAGKKVGGLEALDDIYKMIAEFIFLDFNESTFSSKKRSLHSNVNVNLGTKTRVYFEDSGYVELYPNRYSSFGLSQIKLGVDKLRRAATYKLSYDMIALLNNEDTRITFDNSNWKKYKLEANGILGNIGGEQRDYLEKSWENGIDIAGKNQTLGFNSIINSVKDMDISSQSDRECEKFLDAKVEEANNISREFNSFIYSEIIEDNAKFNAKMREEIFGNITSTEKDIISSCDAEIYAALEDYSYKGVKYAKNFTTSLLDQIERLKITFEKYSDLNIVSPKKIDLITGTENTELTKLKDHYEESCNLFPFPLLKSYAKKTTQRRLKRAEREYKSDLQSSVVKSLTELNNQVMTMINDSLNLLISDRFLKMLERLNDHYETKLRYLNNYEDALKEMSNNFREKFLQYSQIENPPRNIELTLGWDEKEYENQLRKGDEYPDRIKNYLEEFLKGDYDNGLGENTFEELLIACNGYQNNPQKLMEFKKSFTSFVELQTTSFKPNGDINSAIDLFNNSYQDRQERETEIKKLIGYSFPRINLSDKKETDIDIKLLGCDSQQKRFIEDIKKLGKQFDAQEFSKDEVIFFNEIVGFPAYQVGVLSNMKKAYDAMVSINPDENWLRHTDKHFDKFKDLVRPTSSEAKERISRLKPFILAFITNGIQYQGNRFVLQRENNFGKMVGEPLESSLLASVYQMSDSQKKTIERNYGERFFRELDSLPDRDMKYIHLFIVLETMFTVDEKDDHRTMLSIAIKELSENIYIKMLDNLQIPGKTGEILYEEISNSSLSDMKELYPEIKQLFFIKNEEEKRMNSFSVETPYFEKELGRFTKGEGDSQYQVTGTFFRVLKS